MLIRAFVLWGLLLGQAAIILLFLNPATAWMIRESPDAWWIMATCVFGGGVIGCAAEWLWRAGSVDD